MLKILAYSMLALTFVSHQLIAKERTLRAVSAFNLTTTIARDFNLFTNWINKNGKGIIQINVLGGPEALPPFELGNAVQAGIIDVAYNTAAYYSNLVAVGDALHLAQNTIQEQRANGCYTLLDDIHQQHMNVKYLAHVGDYMPYHLYTNKPITGADLTGLTLRTTPVYRAMFEKLGATLVRTAPGDVYSALERGAIDGYGWPSQGVLDLGWHEKTRYRIDPGFYQVNVNVLVNLETWNSLTDQQRALLEEGALWLEQQNVKNIAYNQQEYELQAKAGIKTISLTEKEQEKWLTTAQDEGWAVVEKIDAPLAQKLRTCLSK